MKRYATTLIFAWLLVMPAALIRAADSSPADQLIQTAYKNELGRLPDRQGLRRYRTKITQQQWTQEQIAADLRTTEEWKTRHSLALVQEAFQDVLKRVPTPAEQIKYQQLVLEHGWSKQRLKVELSKLAP